MAKGCIKADHKAPKGTQLEAKGPQRRPTGRLKDDPKAPKGTQRHPFGGQGPAKGFRRNPKGTQGSLLEVKGHPFRGQRGQSYSEWVLLA